MELEQSLVAWVLPRQLNANELSRKVRSLPDLADGVVLYELMRLMYCPHSAPRYFSAEVSEAKDTSAARLANLRKLKAGFEVYMDQVLDIPYENSIDIAEIARTKSASELLKVMELVLLAVIRCEDKERYIGRILGLSEACQGELMVFIETVLGKHGPQSKPEREILPEDPRIQQQNLALRREVDSLGQELAEERARNKELRRQLEELAGSMARVNTQPDVVKIDLEAQLQERNAANLALLKQLEDVKKTHLFEMAALRDELDVANERLMQIPKLETALESYKRKVEDGNSAKRQIAKLEDTIETLQKRIQQLEDERTKVTQAHHSLAVYKDQLTQEKEKSAAFSLTLLTKEKELKDMLREKVQWEGLKQGYEGTIQRLREEAERLRSQDSASEDSFRRSYDTDYEEQIKALESENRRLQVMIGNEELVRHFNEQIDAALIAKKQLEERLKQANCDIASGKSAKLDLEVTVQSLEGSLQLAQSQLKETEERLVSLESELSKLQGVAQENDRLKAEKDGYMADLKQVYREKDELQQKCLSSKDEAHRLREELTRLQGKVRDLGEERPTDTIKQLEIERENLKTSAENSNLKLKLRDSEDQLKDLRGQIARLEENAQKALADLRSELSKSHLEALEKAQRQIEEKERELEVLYAVTDEQKQMWFKEEKLMAAVMHEIGIEVFKERTHKEASYLAVQRERAAKG